MRILSAAAAFAVAAASFAQSTPSVTPSDTIGGLSKCENLLGTEKDRCLRDERAGSLCGNYAR